MVDFGYGDANELAKCLRYLKIWNGMPLITILTNETANII